MGCDMVMTSSIGGDTTSQTLPANVYRSRNRNVKCYLPHHLLVHRYLATMTVSQVMDNTTNDEDSSGP